MEDQVEEDLRHPIGHLYYYYYYCDYCYGRLNENQYGNYQRKMKRKRRRDWIEEKVNERAPSRS